MTTRDSSTQPQAIQAKHNDKPKIFTIAIADIWFSIATVGIFVGVAMVVAKQIFGIDLFGESRSSDIPADKLKDNNDALIIGILTIVICVPLSIYRYRRTNAVLAKGIDTPFTILKGGLIQKSGMKDITIQYTVDGKEYKKKLSISSDWEAEDFKLIVNPDKPTHVVTEGVNEKN